MEEIYVIVLLVLFLGFVAYVLVIQLSWLNTSSYTKKHLVELKNIIEDRNYQFVSSIPISKKQLNKNSPFKASHISFGGTDIMAFEKVFYRKVVYKDNKREKKSDVKIVESVFGKTRYHIDWLT